MTNTTHEPFDPERVTVSMGNIERVLTRMWRKMAEATGPQVVRTMVINLLVYTEGEISGHAFTEVAAALTARHPSRTILLIAEDAAKSETLDAWVEMHCQIAAGGGRQVCGEQISIHATGEAVEGLPAAALPLLLPDLPVVLYWRAVPDFGRPLFQPLARLADRIILDTGLAYDSDAALRALPTAVLERYPHASVGDVNWARLTAWRELTAQLFDAADMRPYLDTITALELIYGRDGGPLHLAQACLYLGWLASRLEWSVEAPIRVDGAGRVSARLRGGHGSIEVRVAPGERGDQVPNSLTGVVIRADGDPPARFEVVQAEDRVCGICRVFKGEQEALERVVAFPGMGETAALSQELDQMARDRTFEQALRAAATISGAPA